MRALYPIIILTILVLLAIYGARLNSKRARRAERRNKKLERQIDVLAHDEIEREERKRLEGE